MDRATYLAAKHTVKRRLAARADLARRNLALAFEIFAFFSLFCSLLFGAMALIAIPLLGLMPSRALDGMLPGSLLLDGRFSHAVLLSYWSASALAYAAALICAGISQPGPGGRLFSIARHLRALDWIGIALEEFGASRPADGMGPNGTIAMSRKHWWKFAIALLGWPFHALFWTVRKTITLALLVRHAPAALDAAARRLAHESPEVFAMHEAAEIDKASSAPEPTPGRTRL